MRMMIRQSQKKILPLQAVKPKYVHTQKYFTRNREPRYVVTRCYEDFFDLVLNLAPSKPDPQKPIDTLHVGVGDGPEVPFLSKANLDRTMFSEPVKKLVNKFTKRYRGLPIMKTDIATAELGFSKINDPKVQYPLKTIFAMNVLDQFSRHDLRLNAKHLFKLVRDGGQLIIMKDCISKFEDCVSYSADYVSIIEKRLKKHPDDLPFPAYSRKDGVGISFMSFHRWHKLLKYYETSKPNHPITKCLRDPKSKFPLMKYLHDPKSKLPLTEGLHDPKSKCLYSRFKEFKSAAKTLAKLEFTKTEYRGHFSSHEDQIKALKHAGFEIDKEWHKNLPTLRRFKNYQNGLLTLIRIVDRQPYHNDHPYKTKNYFSLVNGHASTGHVNFERPQDKDKVALRLTLGVIIAKKPKTKIPR